MKSLSILALLLAALTFDGRREAAAQWCAQYDDYTSNCGFTSFNQCRETIRGVGGVCRFDRTATRPREAERPEPTPSRDGRARENRDCMSLAGARC